MILLDCTVFSNFAAVHRPEFIAQAFSEAISTTDVVFDELKTGMRLRRIPKCDWSWLKKIQLTLAEQKRITLAEGNEWLG